MALLSFIFPSGVPAAPTSPESIPEDDVQLDDPEPVAIPIPNQFIVHFTDPSQLASVMGDSGEAAERNFLEAALKESPASAISRPEARTNLELISIGNERMWFVTGGPADLEERINKSGKVASVEPNLVVEMKGGRESTLGRLLKKPPGDWGLKKISRSEPYLYPSKAGLDVDVYVVDGAVDTTHPEFEGRVRMGKHSDDLSFFPDRHGTAVAGIIASKSWGVAPKATIISVPVFHKDSHCIEKATILKAMGWIIDQVRANKRKSIINVSLGVTGVYETAYRIAIREAVQNNIYVVVAAGNDGVDACKVSPANVPFAIAVGAVHFGNKMARWSNWGSCVDILAPGDNIETTVPMIFGGKARGRVSGTSISAPFVSGALALILSERDFETVREGREYLEKIATQDQLRWTRQGTKNVLLYNGRREESFPSEVPAAPTNKSKFAPDQRFIVTFNKRPSSHSLATEADERRFLELILEESRPSSDSIILDQITLEITLDDDGIRLWVVIGPVDFPDRVNRNGSVAVVEPDQTMSLHGGIKRSWPCSASTGQDSRGKRCNVEEAIKAISPGDWGLKRIAQSDKYLYPSNGGAGVDVYILDSGIDVDHPQFEGRAVNGASFVGDDSFYDFGGHGTHIAGIVNSKSWGVAPNATVISVRVFGENDGALTSVIIRGLGWILCQHKIRNRKSIINMSFGIHNNSIALYRTMIPALVKRGIYVVAGAGNDNINACEVSPACLPETITVGAINFENEMTPASNFGECVDILAPGRDIESTYPRFWPNGFARMGEGRRRLSGTSMAAPFVAGTLALILGERDFETAREGREYLLKIATRGAITKIKPGTVANLLYNGRSRECEENPCHGLVEP
ncbi:hypothetical protein HK102_009092 [Quaeritorhiza haematococci]|nr:hypothetical protein HK102_009092 [Quaeritorhiza haematococci]